MRIILSFTAPLPYRFVNKHTRSYADIKGFDHTGHRQPHLICTEFKVFFIDTLLFRTHYNTGRNGHIDFGIVTISMFGGCDDAKTTFLQILQCVLKVLYLANRQTMQRTRGGFDGIAVDSRTSARTYNKRVYTCAHACTSSIISSGVLPSSYKL